MSNNFSLLNKAKAVRDISLLWLGSLLGATCAFFMQVLLARSLGPEAYGVFSSVLSMASLLVPFAGFGVAQYWLKEFGKEGWGAIRFIRPSLIIIFMNTLFVIILIVLWAMLGPHSKTVETVLLIMTLYIVGQVAIELVASKLQLEEKYLSLAIWQLIPHVVRLLLVFNAIVWMGENFSVQGVAYIFAAVAVCLIFIGFKMMTNMARGLLDLKGHSVASSASSASLPTIRNVLNNAWPFGLAGVFHLIYFQSDIILVKYITGDDAAGYYNVAFTVMVGVLLLPGIIYQKFLLPKMHRWAHYDRGLFYKVYRQGNIVMLALGIIAMTLIWLLAPLIITTVFGASYSEAIELLMALSLSAPILFVASSVGATLVTQEHMRIKVKLMGIVAVLNIGLNLILIPNYGALGAAIATVTCNIVLLILFYYVSEKKVFERPLRQG